jgi:hypothetical protein
VTAAYCRTHFTFHDEFASDRFLTLSIGSELVDILKASNCKMASHEDFIFNNTLKVLFFSFFHGDLLHTACAFRPIQSDND